MAQCYEIQSASDSHVRISQASTFAHTVTDTLSEDLLLPHSKQVCGTVQHHVPSTLVRSLPSAKGTMPSRRATIDRPTTASVRAMHQGGHKLRIQLYVFSCCSCSSALSSKE